MRHVPCIMDDIYVCWEIEGSTIWWQASVVEVLEYDKPRGQIQGQGRLLYKQFKSYAEEDADVQFLYTPRKGALISQRYMGVQLEMSWAMQRPASRSTKIEAAVKEEDTIVDHSNSTYEQSGKRSKVQHISRAQQHRHPKPSKPKASLRSRNLSVVPAPGHESDPQPSGSIENEERLPAVTHVHQTGGSAQSIFDNFLKGSTQYLSSLDQTRLNDRLSQLVIHELRIDLVSELHKNFRASQSLQIGSDDLQQRCLRVSVSCSLSTFSHIAHSIRATSSTDSVRFFPSFEQTQNPSVSATRFTIYFNGMCEFTTALGFNDNRDYATLFWREKCYDGQFYTRVLGSLSSSVSSSGTVGQSARSTDSCKDCATTVKRESTESNSDSVPLQNVTVGEPSTAREPNNSNGPSTVREASTPVTTANTQGVVTHHNEDVIYVGLSSCSSISTDQVAAGTPITPSMRHSTETQVAGPSGQTNVDISDSQLRYPSGIALSRTKVQWENENGNYLCRWHSKQGSITTVPPPAASFSQRTKTLDGVFAIRWEPKVIPRTTAWTSDAFRSDGHVLGKIEAIVPWVLLRGQQCVEFGDILSKKSFKLRP